MGKRKALLALSLAAWVVGMASLVEAHPSGLAALAMIGLPLALSACSWRPGVRGKEVA